MGEGMRCLIWCDECCGANWGEVSARIREGRATSISGRLRVAVECRGCGVPRPEGGPADAVTLHGGGGYVPWEHEYLEAGTGWEEIEAGGERGGWVR